MPASQQTPIPFLPPFVEEAIGQTASCALSEADAVGGVAGLRRRPAKEPTRWKRRAFGLTTHRDGDELHVDWGLGLGVVKALEQEDGL